MRGFTTENLEQLSRHQNSIFNPPQYAFRDPKLADDFLEPVDLYGVRHSRAALDSFPENIRSPLTPIKAAQECRTPK